MTGTSCDGLDAACLSVKPGGWEVLWEESRPYPAELRRRVLAIQGKDKLVSVQSILELGRDLGEWYGRAIGAMVSLSDPAMRPHVIANHGQTIAHEPKGNAQGVTYQIGDAARIVAKTGLTVVSGFRDGDVSAGGEGAPLVPLFHKMIASALTSEKNSISIHNIGGISNLTYIGPKEELIAFDTGPGNFWIDLAAETATQGRQRMDKDGKLAFHGEIDVKAVSSVLAHPYFRKAPPKSTGRDAFPFDLLLEKCKCRDASLVATATAVTVESIARAYETWILGRRLPLKAVLFCGGGAKNPAVSTWLNDRLPSVRFSSLEDCGFDPLYVEAHAFALFGFLALMGQPIGGKWTGAKGFGTPGHILPGRNWKDVVSIVRNFYT
jgi:anhydro-N-acetylmuramic acid kinase